MEINDKLHYNKIHLDFGQARAKHLLFKSKLRSILYGREIDDTSVISHFDCAVGQWIYGHALHDYGHIPEMHELEKVHAEIHISARGLIQLYKAGKLEEAKKGLGGMETIADHLIQLLSIVEIKLKANASHERETKEHPDGLDINLKELHELQKVNYELDIRIKAQSSELYITKERFELVAKATQDAVWDWDLLTNGIWWNDGFKELFGYREEEILPGIESWYNNIHPDDRDRIIQGIHTVIDNGGKQWSDEYRFKRADGSYAIIFDRGYALHDQEGKPYRMVGSMQDITEERQSKEALHRAQVQLEAALSAGNVNAYFWDIKKDLFYADYNLAQLFSVSPEKAKNGLSLQEFIRAIHPEDAESVMKLITNAINTGEYYTADFRVKNVDGEFRWVAAKGRVNYNKKCEPISFPGTLVDITERKKMEEDLARSEEQFRNFGNNLQNLAWIADREGWIFWYNQRWFEYTGTTLDDMQGWGWEKVHHPDHIERVVTFVKEAWKKDEPWELTFPLRRHDGIYRWFLTRGVPIKESNGKIIEWIGTNTDINDKIEIEQELEKRVLERTNDLQEINQMLERSNSELEQFAYVTSHDLQEPLRKIQLFSNILMEQHIEELTDDARKYVGKVSDSAKRMTGLIQDLLDFSRLSQRALHFEEINLDSIFRDVVSDFEILIEQKKATITCSNLPIIHAVPLQINQIFYNLINNSLKFSRRNVPPVINITCKRLSDEKKIIYSQLNKKEEYYEISFKDNGIGFNQDYADKIFTIFQRLNDQSLYGGYGIGLAICQKAAINHKGIIFAQGKEGEGALFVVILPIRQL